MAQLGATLLVTWFVSMQAGLGLDELQALDLNGWTPNWIIIAASSAILLSGYFATGLLWGRIVEDLGGPSLSASQRVRMFMIANLGRYVPGKVWQIAGLAMLARNEGVPGATATAAAILGQGIALVAATLLGLGSLWVVAAGTVWQWVVPIALFGGVLIGLLPSVFGAVSRLWFRLARAEEPKGLTSSAAVVWLGLGLGSWILYAGSFWVLVRGLGLEAHFVPTTSAFAAAYVLGYVMVFAPAGIGVREVALLALLSPQFGPGTAGAVAVIARIWTTVVEIIPATAFWTHHLTTSDGAPKPGE